MQTVTMTVAYLFSQQPAKSCPKSLQTGYQIALLKNFSRKLSQSGFRPGRSTVDMISAARQLQEKCCKQQKNLYLAFIDLTRAFDTICCDSLWALLRKLGCSDKFVNVIKSFHDGVTARVVDVAGLSEPFTVRNSTKQGCVLHGSTPFQHILCSHAPGCLSQQRLWHHCALLN